MGTVRDSEFLVDSSGRVVIDGTEYPQTPRDDFNGPPAGARLVAVFLGNGAPKLVFSNGTANWSVCWSRRLNKWTKWRRSYAPVVA